MQLNFFKKTTFSEWFEKSPITILLVFSVSIRLVLLAVIGFHPNTYHDSENYIQLAERLIDFNLQGYEYERTPGYPLVLGIMGMNFSLVLVLQYVLGVLSTLLVYDIAKQMQLKKVSFFIALATSFIANYHFYENGILTETLSVFLCVLIVHRFLFAKQNTKNYFLIGLLCAFLLMTRTLFLYLAPLLALLFLFESRNTTILKKLVSIAWMVLPTVVCFVMWSSMNKANTGKFGLTSYFGFNLAQTAVGFIDSYEGEHQMLRDIYVKHINLVKQDDSKMLQNSIWEAYDEMRMSTGYSLPELSQNLSEMSKVAIQNNMDRYLVQVFISWKDFWTNDLYWIPSIDNEDTQKVFDLWRKFGKLLQLILNAVFLITGFLSLLRYFIFKIKAYKWLAFMSAVVFSASILQALVIYGDNSRFSFPLYPLITMVAIGFWFQKNKKITTI